MAERQELGGEDITPQMTLAKLAALWLAERANDAIKPQTLDQYDAAVRRLILPGLGALEIREATVSRLDAFLKRLRTKTPAQARMAKVCLSGMLGLAVRHGAIAHNPVRDTSRLASKRAKPRAAADADIQRLRAAIREWESDVDPETGTQRRRGGRVRSKNIADIMDVALATGARIGEVLALRWQDVTLDTEPATVTVAGTLVQPKGQGLIRKPTPKTDAGWRTIPIPTWAIDTLQRQRAHPFAQSSGMVFPSETGTLLSPNNVRNRLRKALKDTGLEWITPHTMRKTVGTAVAEARTTKQASDLLSHTATTTTETHYIAKPTTAPDATDVLARFAPT
jgi:integrase